MKIFYYIGVFLAIFSLLAIGGCKEKKNDGKKEEKKVPRESHEGKKQELGEQTIRDITAKVHQIGEVTPDKEAVFGAQLTGAKEAIKAVRAWIGSESGDGSEKALAEKEKEEYHIHIKAPATIGIKSKLWLEIELASGAKVKGAFKTK